ncbi:transporter substrate-binding domain-containing protein [Rubritalea tangerina]|uniref:transporter substrate-binding domain-containing protein n=1 Tax=Rubritalea tangerina TaxID=430798 RepID=UPI0036141E73
MVTLNWPPFYGEKLPDGGPLTELATEAFRRAGHTASIEFLPWTRALEEVKKQRADIVLGAYYNHERARHYHYSQPMLKVNVGLVANSEARLTQYSSLRDLTAYRIGVCKNFVNSPAFDNAGYLQKDVAKIKSLTFVNSSETESI